jgi:hypothetical protein
MMKYTGNQQEHLKALLNIIVEVLIARKNSFRIAKGDLPAEIVKHGFASLTFRHVEHVLHAISTNYTEVKSTKSYIQTCLWNSLDTIKIESTFNANRFLYEHLGIEKK